MANLDELFAADAAEAIARRRDHTQLALQRQSDGAAQDMRAVGGMIAGELMSSNDPTQLAGLNAGVRTPTTLNHPGNPGA